MAGTDERLIIAIDQSTSATKAIAFTPSGAIAASASSEHEQHYPRPGWVEHDPEELYACTLRSLRSVVGALGAAARRVAALAITNQRETIVVWDRVTGRPACRAPVWLCQRGADLCARLAAAGHGSEARRRTGLPLDPYFSASKIRWILDNVDGARAQAREGRLLFGTVDSWLAWKLTGGRAHVTDPTNASRTLLMNLADLAWDDAMFALFDIPRSMAPTITRSTMIVGTTTAEGIFDREVPIAGLMGDSHAAFFAQRCFSPGEAKATYGTGTSLMK
ncbi:MAG TPA: FGGY family carbohydrate kinase, partial [Spirochaetia bacterium]